MFTQIGNETSEGQNNQEELQNSQKEICELNRTLQTLEIDFQTELNKVIPLDRIILF